MSEPTTTEIVPGTDAPASESPEPSGTPVSRAIEQARRDGHWNDQPRAGDGRWTDGDRPAETTAAESEEPDDEPAAEEVPNEGEAEPGEEDEADEVAPTEDDETEDEAEAPDDESDEAPEGVTVRLPGRGEGEELEIEVSDPETAERLRQVANDGMRRAEFNRRIGEVEQGRAELREVEELIQQDPVGFVTERLDASLREQVTTALLADPEIYERVAETLTGWDEDPSRRDADRYRIRAEQAERRDKLRTEQAEGRAVREHAHAVAAAVRELIPDDADDRTARDFYADAIGDLQRAARERDVAPADVPALLERRLRLYGLPATARDSLTAEHAPSAGDAAARPGGRKAPDPASRAATARATGKRFRQASARRRQVAATAPAGAGAPPLQQARAPKGTGVKGAVEHARKVLQW